MIAEEQGRLPEGTVKKLAIYAECPSPAVRDAQKETEHGIKLPNDAGILSDDTWSEREELDREQELANGATCRAAVPEGTPSSPVPSTSPAAEYAAQTGRSSTGGT